MVNRMPKKCLGLCLLLSIVKLTSGGNEEEICDYALDTCLNYDGHQAKKFLSAVNFCLESGGHLLEVHSTEMLDFVENFFRGHMPKYFPDGEGFNSFVYLEQFQSRDIFISRGLEVLEHDILGVDSMCTKIKLRSNWTLMTCTQEEGSLPVVCSKRPSKTSIFLQCIPAYLMYVSLLVFGVGLAILFTVVVCGFKREIKLRRRKRSKKEQNLGNNEFYEEIEQRSDPVYTAATNNVHETNFYHTLGTAETILEVPCNGMLTNGV